MESGHWWYYGMRQSGNEVKTLARIEIFRIVAMTVALLAQLFAWPTTARSQNVSGRAEKGPPAVGAPAIAFGLETLDGRRINLETFHGKPLIINFFASWCDPCREEMPLVNQLASKGTTQGYVVLGIAVEDGRAAVTQYAEEAKLAFPIALDLNSTVKRGYRIFGPPATFFIDAQGVIRDMVIGPMTPERAGEGLKKAGVGH